MGISCSPYIFREKMSDLMQHLNFVSTYLDDLLVISSSIFEDPLEKLECVFKFLSEISKSGMLPIPKKVEGIKHMVRPTIRKELRRFISMVDNSLDMYCPMHLVTVK
jgi:hypothetical protein